MFSDRRIRDALEAGKVGVWYWDVERDEVQWSPNLAAIHNLPPGQLKKSIEGFTEDIHPDDRDGVRESFREAFRKGGYFEGRYRLPPTADGEVRWLEAKGMAVVEKGLTVAMHGVCYDVTDRKRSERELEQRLKQQEIVASLGQLALETENLQELFDAVVETLARTIQVENTKVLEGVPGGDSLRLRAGVGWKKGLVGTAEVGAGMDSQAGYTLLSNEPVIVLDLARETRFTGPPLLHDHDIVSGMSTIIAGPEGKPWGVLGVHSRSPRAFSQYDVNFLQAVANILGSAVQKDHANAAQHLLHRELRHRVGNLFSQTLAIHAQTASHSEDIPTLSRKFGERIQALARVHELISQTGWSSTSLRQLLETLLSPYESKITLHGPAALLPADTAFHLSMAINELVTNAAKYGGLADNGGGVMVEWRLEAHGKDRNLVLDWTEAAGRLVEPPEKTSFGSKLIDSIIRHQLSGSLSKEFTAQGLRLQMILPQAVPEAIRWSAASR